MAFFKISCPVCQFTLPFLERVREEKKIVGISQDSEEDTRDFNREFGLKFPMLLDREDDAFPAGNGFGITHVPTIFQVESDGRIGRIIEGWDKKQMEALGALRPEDRVPASKPG